MNEQTDKTRAAFQDLLNWYMLCYIATVAYDYHRSATNIITEIRYRYISIGYGRITKKTTLYLPRLQLNKMFFFNFFFNGNTVFVFFASVK